jgi:hypothetical protein
VKLNDMIAQARRDLARFGFGTRGSEQRVFRMYFWLVRMNSLGRAPQVRRSLAEVDALVLEQVRQRFPRFVPEMA